MTQPDWNKVVCEVRKQAKNRGLKDYGVVSMHLSHGDFVDTVSFDAREFELNPNKLVEVVAAKMQMVEYVLKERAPVWAKENADEPTD